MSSRKDASVSESLRIQQLIPASPERVFSAWTDPDELTKWWGPANVRCLSADVELRVGGRYRIENELPDGSTLWIVGEFEAIERPHLLIYTWMIDTESPTVERVSVRFDEHEQGTEVVLIHELIPTPTLRDQHRQGWLGCLGGMVEYLST